MSTAKDNVYMYVYVHSFPIFFGNIVPSHNIFHSTIN